MREELWGQGLPAGRVGAKLGSEERMGIAKVKEEIKSWQNCISKSGI